MMKNEDIKSITTSKVFDNRKYKVFKQIRKVNDKYTGYYYIADRKTNKLMFRVASNAIVYTNNDKIWVSNEKEQEYSPDLVINSKRKYALENKKVPEAERSRFIEYRTQLIDIAKNNKILFNNRIYFYYLSCITKYGLKFVGLNIKMIRNDKISKYSIRRI